MKSTKAWEKINIKVMSKENVLLFRKENMLKSPMAEAHLK